MNHVVNSRLSKCQQMRWSMKGTHCNPADEGRTARLPSWRALCESLFALQLTGTEANMTYHSSNFHPLPARVLLTGGRRHFAQCPTLLQCFHCRL